MFPGSQSEIKERLGQEIKDVVSVLSRVYGMRQLEIRKLASSFESMAQVPLFRNLRTENFRTGNFHKRFTDLQNLADCLTKRLGFFLLLCSVFFLKYSTDRTGHSSDQCVQMVLSGHILGPGFNFLCGHHP